MDTADKLIEYYFQRKIAGMPSADIHQSLEQQMLDEEEREIIVSQVEYRESLYIKALNQKKKARIITISGILILFAAASIFIYTLLSGNSFINPIIIYIVFGIGAAVALSSFVLFPKGHKTAFRV